MFMTAHSVQYIISCFTNVMKKQKDEIAKRVQEEWASRLTDKMYIFVAINRISGESPRLFIIKITIIICRISRNKPLPKER